MGGPRPWVPWFMLYIYTRIFGPRFARPRFFPVPCIAQGSILTCFPKWLRPPQSFRKPRKPWASKINKRSITSRSLSASEQRMSFCLLMWNDAEMEPGIQKFVRCWSWGFRTRLGAWPLGSRPIEHGVFQRQQHGIWQKSEISL